jgi:hypothetical protein
MRGVASVRDSLGTRRKRVVEGVGYVRDVSLTQSVGWFIISIPLRRPLATNNMWTMLCFAILGYWLYLDAGR